MKYALVLFAFMAAQWAQAQKESISFRVEGVCGMCEDRIEGALDVPGVVVADWDLETKMLSVVYRSKKITEQELHDLVHAVGHDTSAGKATDDEYAGLHGCCKYREGASCPHEGKE
jgi:copper chaperone CopZ